MERGCHGRKARDGRSPAFDKVMEGIELVVAVAGCEGAPREWTWDVFGDRRMKGGHGGELAGEHSFAWVAGRDLRRFYQPNIVMCFGR